MLIDTEQAKKQLLSTEFTEQQASGILEVIRMLEGGQRANLATKEDLGVLEAELKRTITLRLLGAVSIVLAGIWGLLELYLG